MSPIQMKSGTHTEQSIIERMQDAARGTPTSRSSENALVTGIGDDAAIWRPRQGYETILTCDWFLQGTHFLPDRHSPDIAAYKSLARAISDIAAMGGEPRCFLLSLALPRARTGAWLNKFLSALRAAARAMHCPLAGGDTTQRNEILINIIVVGECERGRAILRSGARPGDAIFVTGTLGEAEYGLELLRSSSAAINLRDPRLRKHIFPEPRVAAGQWLANNRCATAMMDLSDGLSSDLPKLCQASRVGARIIQRNLPSVKIAENHRKKFDAAQLALHGGDDYELLFTVAKKNVARIPARIGRVRLTQIGEITSGKQIMLVRESEAVTKLASKGWDPFH